MKIEKFSHIPVMLNEALALLKINPNGTYVDATVGGAGHSIEIAKQITSGALICFDKDPDAVATASTRLKPFPCAKVVHSCFSNIKPELEKLSLNSIDGILADLGVSSFQLDNPSRGFSYKTNGPIDMRMSKKGVSAFEVVNKFEESKIAHILKKFGEEVFAHQIAKKMALFRSKEPITTTTQLADIVKSAVPAKFRRLKNPCKKTFQAIRIYVNNELDELQIFLKNAFDVLKPGGRLVIISFHSLEDRIIKHHFIDLSKKCICPPEFPICVCNNEPKAVVLTKKPITPSVDEQAKNSRCKSAKLRAIEKL